MGLDALLAKLDADARREREEIISRATRRAEAVREEAEAELKRSRTRALDEVRAEERAEARKKVVEARTEARHIVFQARHDLLRRIRSATEERIDGGADDEAYRSALPDEVDAVLRRAPAGAMRVRAAPGLVEALRDALSEARTEIVADDDVGTGFVAVGAEGAVIIDATLSARLERAWPAEAMRLLQELG